MSRGNIDLSECSEMKCSMNAQFEMFKNHKRNIQFPFQNAKNTEQLHWKFMQLDSQKKKCLHAIIVESTFQPFLCLLEIKQSSSLKSASLFQA